MAPAAIERMSRVDTAWLRMDTEANLMMIVGVWLLSPPLPYEALAERVRGTLLKYPRFRQKVVEDAMGASWVDVGEPDLGAHIVREPLHRGPGESAEQALKARVAELAAEPLDRARPLWQFHLVEDLGDGRSALVSRIHHCIADGIALISVMLAITDGGRPPPQRARRARDERADEDWLSEALIRPLTELTVKAIDLGGSGMAKSMALSAEMLTHPAQPLFGSMAGSVKAARAGLQVLGDAAALALMADDAPTRLKGRAQPGKRVAWGPPLPLDDVKAVGRALGGSINDVLLACVAGAIGDWLKSQGETIDGKQIRAMVPVNLRPAEEAWKLGNRFGLVPLTLPIGVGNPVQRVHEVRQRMAELKGSTQPMLAFAVLALAGLLVKPAQHALLNLFSRKATAVMTNVPGPREPLKFCGRTVDQVMFWVPQSGDIGVGVSILSYGGGVQFGLITDAAMCPDPQAIIDRFAPEFEKLTWLALMLPWGEAA